MKQSRRWLISVSIVILALLVVGSTESAYAQGTPHVTLVGRAILPPDAFADGPSSGNEIGQKTVNGAPLPFPSQPVGSTTAIIRGEYKGTWLLMSDHGFDTSAHAGDYLLRTYTVEIDWHTASGGTGVINLDAWKNLGDPNNKLKLALKAADRQLTGADIDPRSIVEVAKNDYWIAETKLPSLLDIDQNGDITRAGLLTGFPAGTTIEGMGLQADGKTLLLAIRSGSKISLATFDTVSLSLTDSRHTYTLENGSNRTRGWLPINDKEALVIEEDGGAFANAHFKRIYLIDFSGGSGPVTKTLIADLLNIADPDKIATSDVFSESPKAFGLSNPFQFAYDDVSSVYPVDGSTLIVINNNHFPFSKGRNGQSPAGTEAITIKLDKPLNLQIASPAN